MNYDRILTSTPVNAMAGRVVSRGVQWQPRKKLSPGLVCQDTPPPIFRAPCNAPRLIGMKVDRLTVVGYAGNGSHGARWVCRCTCGNYTTRKTKSLMSEQAKTRARCAACDYLEELKAGRGAPA